MSAGDMSRLKELTLGFVPGTGRMGSNLARHYACAGFKVWLGSRDASKAKALAREMCEQFQCPSSAGGGGAEGAAAQGVKVQGGSNQEAADAADVVFWCIGSMEGRGSLEARHSLLRGLQEELRGKVVVDVTNILYLMDESSWGQVSSTLFNKEALGVPAKWTCAWKSTFWKLLEEPPSSPMATFVCGDDPHAVELVMALVEQVRPFKAINGGALKNTKIVELLGPPWIGELDKLNCGGELRSGWMYGK